MRFYNDTNTIVAFRCRSGLTFSDPDECTRFYLCIGDEEVVLATCPNGYHYSKRFATCLPPEDAECQDGSYIRSVQNEKINQCFLHPESIHNFFFNLERSGLLSLTRVIPMSIWYTNQSSSKERK